MRVEHEAELRVAVAEGLLERKDVEPLRQAAERRDCSPLLILREQGKISEETLNSLSSLAQESMQLEEALDDTACGETPAVSQLARKTADISPPTFPVQDWDRYELVRFLGQGGMGKVFLARDRHLGRSVAIKFVRGDDPDVASRFLSEARAQARVQHDYVCKVYEVGEVDGKVYIAMQYIDGQPLGTIAATLTVEQRAMVMHAAALGLHEAHRVGIIHRE